VSILTDEHLCALGRVTVNVAALEQYLRNIIGEMVSSDRQVGQIITSKFSFYESLQTFESLCRREIKHRGGNPALLQRLDTLFDEANRLRDDRNDVIHSAWRADSNGEARILRPDASSRNGQHRPQGQFISADAINEVAERAIKLHSELDRLVREELRLLTNHPR
jgi:hypothetical protein